MFKKYDVIVVGGGHAGCEAAAAAATLGSQVLLITMNMATIGQMSCNPAMGGVAKGQIIREIDALGGLSGIVSDRSMIQFRMLNRSKGPAMWSPRTQNDRFLFAQEWRLSLEKIKNIDFWQETVKTLLVQNNAVYGVKTGMGNTIKSKAVILTNGTFLNGKIHIGEKQFSGGRVSEKAATCITEQLASLGFSSGRMKTGTPPRVDGRSLNYSLMAEQAGDSNPSTFSFTDTTPLSHQRSCYITHTNPNVHDILKTGFKHSPLFTGKIKGAGPRYCPSIEDKITRFSERDRHQLFVEPEGWDTVEVYVNGFSSSLPEQIQHKALKKILGFEHIKMFRPGYAIEYDYFPPTQLSSALETKLIKNLFFAGQINGTTGYEEAAAQGLIAGINAHHKVNKTPPFVLSRSEAYIGVLIDDLINKGTEEPYRMFTSRAEFRILLRHDNADIRLTQKGYALGLASQLRVDRVNTKLEEIQKLEDVLRKVKVSPSQVNTALSSMSTAPLKETTSLRNLIKRPEVDLYKAASFNEKSLEKTRSYSPEVCEQVELKIKYENYIKREEQLAKKLLSADSKKIAENFDYNSITALSAESREKLSLIMPKTLGQASRISGVSPTDISILLTYISHL